MNSTIRKTNMELLRIIAMICIVFSHIAAHGEMTLESISINKVFYEIIRYGGSIGNNLFILISGYFMINSTFRYTKAIKLILQVTFYSVLLTILSFAVGQSTFSIKKILQACVPFLSGKAYWFFVTYLEVYFLSPLLNYGLKSLSKNQYKTILFFFGFLHIIVYSVVRKVISINDFGYNNLIWMIYVYIIGAYFRLYPISIRYRRLSSILLPCCILIMIGMKMIIITNVLGGGYTL